MLDKTVPYYGVLMVKDNPSEYPVFQLPEGYSFCMFENGDENLWSELKVDVGEFNDVTSAIGYFNTEFMPHVDELYKRCIFVKDKFGKVAGTTTLWYGDSLSDTMERIHWVSVHPHHQGKGIAKALLTKAFDVYNELKLSGKVYLTTQTWSYKAINIYLKFGFKPYMGAKPQGWKQDNDNFETDNKKAWNIIFDKINNR